jgi:hypothetical protein
MAKSSFATLKRTVRVIAIIIGILAAVGVPTTFGLQSYRDQVSRLAFRTNLATRRIAEYAHIHGDNWRFNLHRIADFIAPFRIDEHQRVFDSTEHLLTELGTPVDRPALRIAKPIIVHGKPVGKVQSEVSLVPLMIEIGFLGVLGVIFGASVFVCMQFIPMRALRAAIAEHEEVQGHLRSQIEQTQAAALQARQATAAKSAFLAMMSHEIRTPMNAVIGLSSALLDSRLDSEQRHLVDTISQSGNDLLRLLNDILDFSKLDAGRVELEALPFSPAALIDHVVSIMEMKAAEKGLTIRAIVDPGLPATMIGDHARLQQVLLNLTGNAVKFTPAGVVEVGLRCVSRSADAATVECTVRDTGIGISPEQIEKLFSEFTQADSSISRKFGGTGLGLVISKQIIEQMDGTIRVESTPGVGTTFIVAVTLPTADIQALAHTQAPPGGDKHGAMLAGLRQPLRVMLAEDNDTNQLVFSKLVQGLNIELTIAQTGREALDRARARAFDVVFMDMRMPDMDGLESTRAIRALGGPWRDIPIIALTANAFADDVKACLDAGMSDFIAKPLRKALLFEKLAKALVGHPFIAPADLAAAAVARPAPGANPAPASVPPPPAGHGDLEPVIDRAILDELVEAIGADGAGATLGVFIAETTARLDRMRSLSCDEERARIRDEAHTLKGAAGTLGLRRLSALALMLEHSAPSITPADYAQSVACLGACFESARREVVLAIEGLATAA